MFDKDRIENAIENAMRGKMDNYNPESDHKPFHTRLIGRDRMALFSFIQSLNTTFGTTIFEKVAEQIAIGNFDHVELQKKMSGEFSSDAQSKVTEIMNDLRSGKSTPAHKRELEEIRRFCTSGTQIQTKLPNADVFLVKGGRLFLIDIKTVKPNSGEFEKYKQFMLEWICSTLYEEPGADVRTIIAMPYNPYYPDPYKRWTMRGMLEIENQSQLMVDDEFWNFLAGGDDVYEDLLDCFKNVGMRMRDDIDEYFRRFS